jgi:hypothetical protein
MAQKTTHIFEDAAAFDAAVDVFDGNATMCESLIGSHLLSS